jgi:hypothetical protein
MRKSENAANDPFSLVPADRRYRLCDLGLENGLSRDCAPSIFCFPVSLMDPAKGSFVSKKFCKFLRALYPEAYELALLRILAGQSIFFDRTNHPLYGEDLILVCLLLAHLYVAKLKLKLELTDREQRIWNKRFQAEILSRQKRSSKPVK